MTKNHFTPGTQVVVLRDIEGKNYNNPPISTASANQGEKGVIAQDLRVNGSPVRFAQVHMEDGSMKTFRQTSIVPVSL